MLLKLFVFYIPLYACFLSSVCWHCFVVIIFQKTWPTSVTWNWYSIYYSIYKLILLFWVTCRFWTLKGSLFGYLWRLLVLSEGRVVYYCMQWKDFVDNDLFIRIYLIWVFNRPLCCVHCYLGFLMLI